MNQPIFWYLQKNESVAQPSPVPSIRTSDNWTGQCLINTLGGVGLPIQAFLNRFLSVLLHVALHCHVAKSFCRVSAGRTAILSSMLNSNTSTVVDSDLLWWFWLVWAAHDKLHPADPTKCRAEASNYGYSALLLMLINGWAYPHYLLHSGLL